MKNERPTLERRIHKLLSSVTLITALYSWNVGITECSEYSKLESNLYTELFSDYNAMFRPEQQTTVYISMSLASLVDVNEKEGHITTTFIPKMSWVDPRLYWNVSSSSAPYYEINHLQVRSTDVWLPDIEVINRFQDTAHDSAMKPLVWVHSDGLIFHVPRRTYQTPCTFELQQFPYDIQHCRIILGSWAYLKSEVDFILSRNGTDQDFYVGHTDFALTLLNISRVETIYGGLSASFVELFVDISLARRPHFFYYMYLMPADIMLFVLPFVHLLPPNKAGRPALLGAVFISIILMLNMLADFMPGYYSEDTPKPLKLYLACMFSTFVSVIGSCISLSLSNTDSKTGRVPLILQRLLTKKAMCCSGSQSDQSSYRLLHLEKMLQNSGEDEEEREMTSTHEDSEETGPLSVVAVRQQQVVRTLQQLVSELQLARYREQVKVEWVKLAQLVDRLFAIGLFISALCLLGINHYSAHSTHPPH